MVAMTVAWWLMGGWLGTKNCQNFGSDWGNFGIVIGKNDLCLFWDRQWEMPAIVGNSWRLSAYGWMVFNSVNRNVVVDDAVSFRSFLTRSLPVMI